MLESRPATRDVDFQLLALRAGDLVYFSPAPCECGKRVRRTRSGDCVACVFHKGEPEFDQDLLERRYWARRNLFATFDMRGTTVGRVKRLLRRLERGDSWAEIVQASIGRSGYADFWKPAP